MTTVTDVDGILDFSKEKRIYESLGEHKHTTFFVGIDEVGRGAWAGALYIGLVCLPFTVGERPNMIEIEKYLAGVNDSKSMSAKRREHYNTLIRKAAIAYSFGVVYADQIDKYGITQATSIALDYGLSQLKWLLENKGYVNPLFVCLADEGIFNPELDYIVHWDNTVKGDSKELSIAAASIIAKVERDQYMDEQANLYKGYNLEKNKGYASQDHIRAVNEHGLSSIHRRTFKVKGFNK